MQRWLFGVLSLMAMIELHSMTRADDEPQQSTETHARTGPETEKRFPPLELPDGFQATLFACDPLIEYPSVIALGPRPGTVFVAHDYMTGLGVEIIRRDEVRLVLDSDADGYAEHSVVYADECNSIQGLAFHDGDVFVMHAPLLTRLRDTNGDGVADQRRDLITGLGLPPEENDNRLHCANGIVAGHDGWLYLALGDRGCDVKRPEGDRLLFQQGGILRCRADGSDLHVFSTGLRNIYDIALDDSLNVFVRDNENDGGDYMIRVCHCFFGSDHGYPYHYYERPDAPMPPLADLGRGSSAGGTSYLETAFPAHYRDSLYFCEWGRGVVRYHRTPKSSSFAPMTEIDFATGAQDDPYGFRPTDLVVDYDGSLLISDWCDGQRPKRGRGRIYRVSSAESAQTFKTTASSDLDHATLIRQLDAESHHQRVAAQLEIQRRGAVAPVVSALESGQFGLHGRLHAIWIIAQSTQDAAVNMLFNVAASDSDARVRAQAIRAIGDLTDPILQNDRISSRPGDHRIAERIAEIVGRADPGVLLEAMIVMRRLQWSEAPGWIARHLSVQDPALDHAAQQLLRNAANWPAVDRLLDDSPRLRRIALQTILEQRDCVVADQLINRLRNDGNAENRREYADVLAGMARKTEPWTYWGFRPAPRPAATVDWERTTAIESALNTILRDKDFDVRAFVLSRMVREGIEPDLSLLVQWLSEETDAPRVDAILGTLPSREAAVIQPVLTRTILRQELSDDSRLVALAMLIAATADNASPLVPLAEQLEDGPVLASVLLEFGLRPEFRVDDLLLRKLDSDYPVVRATAIRSLAKRRNRRALEYLGRLLLETDADVRLAAVKAAGSLGAAEMTDSLLDFAHGSDPTLITASLDSLRQLQDSRAVAVAADALARRETQSAAMDYLKVFGTPDQIDRVVHAAARNPSSGFQSQAVRTLVSWQKQFAVSRETTVSAIATLHGISGQPLAWRVSGPLSNVAAERLLADLKDANGTDLNVSRSDGTTTAIADGSPATLSFNGSVEADTAWVAWTPIRVDGSTPIEILTSATGRLRLWLNGDEIHAREESGEFQPDSDRISTTLKSGTSLLVANVGPDGSESARFHLRFRRRSSKIEHERLVAYALKTVGSVDRGRKVFANAEKAACIRCHRLGPEGGRIGPDLTGIGSRFSRIHLIESILEPSRTVAPSYTTVVVAMNDGKVISGIRVSESDETLVLGDSQGKLHQIATTDVEEIATQTVSTMPDGLEKKLSDREFADLLAFLESEKSARSK